MLLKWKCKKWRRRRWRKDVIYGKQRNVDSAAKGSIVPETSAQWPNVPLHSSHCPYQSDQLCKEDENIFDKQSITFFYMLRYCQSQPHLCILWCQIEVDFWILWCRRRGGGGAGIKLVMPEGWHQAGHTEVSCSHPPATSLVSRRKYNFLQKTSVQILTIWPFCLLKQEDRLAEVL